MMHDPGYYRDLQAAYGTDSGPHSVDDERYETFAAAIDGVARARRQGVGYRYLRNLTTGRLLDSDQRGWRRENWDAATWERFGLDPRYA